MHSHLVLILVVLKHLVLCGLDPKALLWAQMNVGEIPLPKAASDFASFSAGGDLFSLPWFWNVALFFGGLLGVQCAAGNVMWNFGPTHYIKVWGAGVQWLLWIKTKCCFHVQRKWKIVCKWLFWVFIQKTLATRGKCFGKRTSIVDIRQLFPTYTRMQMLLRFWLPD